MAPRTSVQDDADERDGARSDEGQAALLVRLTALEAAASARALTLTAFEKAKASADEAERFAAAQEAEAQQAANAADALKVYRAWDKKAGEFDACPQAPRPGEMLGYFESEDGMRASQQDPLLQRQVQVSRSALPPRGDASAASTASATPGVYTAKQNDLDGPVDRDAAQRTRPSAPRSRQRSPTASRGSRSPTRTPRAARTFPEAPASDRDGIHASTQASTTLNIEVLRREYETTKLTNTASAAQVRARGRDGTQFALGCRSLDFGDVTRGNLATRKLSLQNVALGAARFLVDQVAAPLSVAYPHAPVPVGLKAQVAVTFTAGESAPAGEWCGEVVVRSAYNVLRCPVHACVVEQAQPAEQGDVG